MEQLILIPITPESVKPVEHWVTKANALVEANYRLSLVQQKIVITMASLIQPEDEDFKWYRLHVKHFMEILGTNNHNIYREMVSSVHNLMERVVTIYLGGEEYLKTHWVQKAKYRVGGGYVEISFDPDLKPFFLHLKEKFTTYKLKNVMQLKSSYSIRIYELLKQYQGIGKRTITVDSLRKMLGIEPEEYTAYNNMKRRVIVVAHKEINEKTDISFEFKEIKAGRKVNELEFIIQKKTPSPGDGVDSKKKSSAPAFHDLDPEAAKMKKKVEEYLAQLSSGEKSELLQQAEDRARRESGVLYKNRQIPEQLLRGYMYELAEERLK
jgi:plasmid replication initiation protein